MITRTHARTHEDIDVEMSRHVGEHVNATDKNCFENALAGLAQDPDAYLYVEGYVVWDYFPHSIAHGWIETVSGQIIDPTPSYHDVTKRIKKSWGRTYFPANYFTFTQVQKIFSAKRGKTLVPFSDWEAPQKRLGERAKKMFETFQLAQESYLPLEILQFMGQGKSPDEVRTIAFEQIDRIAGTRGNL